MEKLITNFIIIKLVFANYLLTKIMNVIHNSSKATVVAVCHNQSLHNVPINQVNITEILRESDFTNYRHGDLLYVKGVYFHVKMFCHNGNYIDKTTIIINSTGEQLWPEIQESSSDSSSFIVESVSDYSDSESDELISNNWKKDIKDSNNIEKFETIVNRLKKVAKDNQVTIEKILTANIDDDDKSKAMILYDRLEECEQFSLEYNYIVHRINSLLEKTNNTQQYTYLKERLTEILNLQDNIETRILKADIDDERKAAIYEQFLQYDKITDDSNIRGRLEEWIEEAIKTPFQKTVETDCSLVDLKNGFTKNLSSLSTVLEPLLTIFNNRKNNPNSNSLVIGLMGSPGVGKTAVGKTIAETWGIPFKQISLGGMADSSILSGQHKGWLGSSPGRITKALQEMKVINGIIFLDEIDKLGTTERGMQVQHTLLHAIDPIQNKTFIDNYLGSRLPLDLSKCIFICTLNTTEGLDPALLNRMHIIRVPDYTFAQKTEIMKEHLFPQALKNAGLKECNFILTDDACSKLQHLIQNTFGKEGGVRNLKAGLTIIADKISLVLNNTPKDLEQLNITYKIPIDNFPLSITKEIVEELYTVTETKHYNSMYQ